MTTDDIAREIVSIMNRTPTGNIGFATLGRDGAIRFSIDGGNFIRMRLEVV